MSLRSEQQASEARVARLRERLHGSRSEIFTLAHAMKGDQPPQSEPAELDTGFPHSRLMRAVLGQQGRLLLGGAAVALTLLRPKLLWRALRLTPLLRPLILQYVLPRLLGQR